MASAAPDFAFETTLAGRSYVPFLRDLRNRRYATHLFYLWVPTAELALSRIADRVRHGGHNVPERTVRRRFARSLRNLFVLYRELVDSLYFFDNSGTEPDLIFEVENQALRVYRENLYEQITSGIA